MPQLIPLWQRKIKFFLSVIGKKQANCSLLQLLNTIPEVLEHPGKENKGHSN